MRFEIPEAVVAANQVAKQDTAACIHCGVCVDRCHFQARSLHNGTLVFDTSKCFGCGVCISTCPTDAISMVEKVQD